MPIARHLTQQGIPTPAKKTVWQKATVESILRNEKYKGAALLQKSFTVDFLQKKTKINEGEVPQYYVEHSHEAIISPEEWDKVRQNWRDGRTAPGIRCATVLLPEKSSAAIAVRFLDQRYGTATANTAGPFGGATLNTKAVTLAAHPTFTKMT